MAALESALSQPQQVFGDEALYPDAIDKAAELGFFLISNHPFVDGNKRIGHAVMEVITLLMNGLEILAGAEEQEQVILAAAAGQMNRNTLTAWLRKVVTA